MGCIYLVRNKIDGKCYVGKTIYSMERRRIDHERAAEKGKPDLVFYRALMKHGFDAFEWQVLDWCDNNKVLVAMERMYIRRLNTKVPNGYNLTDGGEGTSGWIHSQKTREAIGNANRGKTRTPELRASLSRIHLGRKPSPTACEAMRTAALKSWKNPERKIKQTKAMEGNRNATDYAKTRERDKKGRFL